VLLEPEVLFLFALTLKENPHAVRVVEGYADEAAHEAHLTTPHFLKYKAQTADMVVSLRLIETDPITIKSKIRIADGG